MLKLNLRSDKRLIERIRSNDRQVLGELFVQNERMIASYVRTHGGSAADAEDILQETIIVLWQKVNSGSFQLTARVSTYLMAVARNKWMAEVRKRKRFVDGENSAEPLDEAASLLDSLIAEEDVQRLRLALQDLGSPCRQLLMLFYFEERSMADIAAIMGFKGPDVVKSKKYQCKKALEAQLKKAFSDAEGKVK